MKIRVKSAEEIKQYIKRDNGDYSNNSIWLFTKDKFKFCDKIFTAKPSIFFEDRECETYILYDGKKKIPFHWEKWMFHKIPEKDKNGNYLLGF